MAELSRDKRQMCDIQGRLFEFSAREGQDSADFIDAFMDSNAAAALDRTYDRLQWAGEEYIFEELLEETGGFAALDEPAIWPNDALFWIGYVYRLWHYLTGESSATIKRAADARTMYACWPGYHTLDPEFAIERLREAAALRRQP